MRLKGTAGTGGTAGRNDHDITRGRQATNDRWQQRQSCRRGIAPRNRDGTRSGQLVPLSWQLGQPVRPGSCMGRLIELLPGISLLKPKVGSAIDDHGVGMQLGSYFSRSTMWQREEHHIVIGQQL